MLLGIEFAIDNGEKRCKVTQGIFSSSYIVIYIDSLICKVSYL